MTNSTELLAPAGSLDILKAATDAGADAVYIGVGAFNARINAVNFTEDELIEACRYAHRRNSRVYLTLNTIINDAEMEDALTIASNAYNSGIDAILVQDIGLAARIHESFPAIPLHASTQMNIYDKDSFKKLSELGISRVVLPRELSLDEIVTRTQAARKYNIETEVFIHGAVCVCYSGLCLFSSMNKSGTRSGNRGMCAQPCRQEYSLSYEDQLLKEGHLISPKDRSTVEYINHLLAAGVASFKIEGRMRDKNYVMSVVDSYRHIIDACMEGHIDRKEFKRINNDLLINFNRGGSFTSQYMSGHKRSDFLSGEYVGKFGLKLGNIIRTDRKQGTIEFTFDTRLPVPSKGDYLSIRSGNKELFSFPAGKIHEQGNRLVVKGLHPDSISSIKGEPDVYLMNHDTVKLTSSNSRKTPVRISLKLEGTILTAECEVSEGLNRGVSGSYDLMLDPDYQGNTIPPERLLSQMSKSGDAPFKVIEVVFDKDIEIKCPISMLNELRRGVFEDLISSIDYEREHICMREFIPATNRTGSSEAISGTIKTMYYFPAVKAIKGDLRRDTDIYAFSVYDLALRITRDRIYDFLDKTTAEIVMVLPDAYHDLLDDTVTRLDQILSREYEGRYLGILDSGVFNCRQDNKHYLSAGANLFNGDSLCLALNNADAATVSYELSPQEALATIFSANIPEGKSLILHSGGPIPWMQSDFCPLGANKKGCKECYEKAYTLLKDKDGNNECYVVSHSADCSSMIYGNPKYVFDDDDAEAIAKTGINVIQMFSEI